MGDAAAFGLMKPLDNVLVLIPDCHTGGHYAGLWRKHFLEGLQDVVPRVISPEGLDYGWARLPGQFTAAEIQAARDKTNDRLWNQIRQAHQQHGLAAVVSYCYSHDVDPQVVTGTIGLGIPWINFFCDSAHSFHKVEALARLVSLNWFPESAAREDYARLGVPWLHAPYALNPRYLPDLSCQQAEHVAGFIGVPIADRLVTLGWLRLLGLPVTIRGPGWVPDREQFFANPVPLRRRWREVLRQGGWGNKVARRVLWPWVRPQIGGMLDASEFDRFIRSCQLILNLNQAENVRGRWISYLKFRDLEFPGYGCACLTQGNADIEAVLEPGREVLVYEHVLDAACLARDWLSRPEALRQLGQRARQRVLREHNWQVRLDQIQAAL